MSSRQKAKWLKLLVVFGTVGLATVIFFASHTSDEELAQQMLERNLENRIHISHAIGENIKQQQLPHQVELKINSSKARLLDAEYTIEPHLQKEAERLLKSYKPDYGAIFMMDAESGRVLAMTSFQKDDPNASNLVLRASYPAASVFKVITATAAVDRAGVSPHHTIHFNGGNYTLYRKNVMSDKINRWTRSITLKEAFARSINTAFGRLSLENLNPEDINEYANRFMFNQQIPADFPVDIGVAHVPAEKSFELTEVASGYNKMNRMSPVQGAMIAAAVVNDGKMLVPFVVDTLKDSEGNIIYNGQSLNNGQIMSSHSAEKVREMMDHTVIAGTSRKSFRQLVRNRKFREIQMGGKTGHLTGDNPKGRVDWFVGYATDDNRKISIAAITVNKQYWTVKSSYIGQTMFKKYFEPVIAERKTASQRY